MKLKRFVSAFILSAFSVMLSVNASAENTIDKSKFGDVLVSFLYFAGVLALIYLILYLVNRWGKKHQNDNKDNSAEQKGKDTDKEDNANNIETESKIKEDKSDKGENEE